MSSRILTEIWIYPIKSLAGIRLPKANVMEKGLQYDRRWMLVDEQGRFLTQREHPEMALFTISMMPEGFLITSQKKNTMGSSILLPFESKSKKKTEKVQIWDDEVEAAEVDPIYSRWFSESLGIACKLVFFHELNARAVDRGYAKNNEEVSLADAYPFLIIGESSLKKLNDKLEQPVGMMRFRPNFVFAGGDAFEEDTWNNFSIGSVSFYAAKPCSRCILTTVDPETGIKGIEPLRTLSTFRKINSKILFGQNVLALEHGEVKEGNTINVIDLKIK